MRTRQVAEGASGCGCGAVASVGRARAESRTQASARRRALDRPARSSARCGDRFGELWAVDGLRDADEVVEAAQGVGRARAGADRDDVDAQAGGAVQGRGGAALVFAEPAGGEQP